MDRAARVGVLTTVIIAACGNRRDAGWMGQRHLRGSAASVNPGTAHSSRARTRRSPVEDSTGLRSQVFSEERDVDSQPGQQREQGIDDLAEVLKKTHLRSDAQAAEQATHEAQNRVEQTGDKTEKSVHFAFPLFVGRGPLGESRRSARSY